MIKAEFSLNEQEDSNLKLILDVSGAPDTYNPDLPGSPKVRPVHVVLLAYPINGAWEFTLANVIGPKVHNDSGNLTKKHYSVLFVSPLGPDSKAPDWIRDEIQKWQEKFNRD